MEIAEISSRLAIQELTSQYTDAILRVDVDAYAACWTDSASWHIMGQHLEGRAQIVDFYKALTGAALHVRHVVHSPILRIDGNTAKGRWQVTETVCLNDGTGSVIMGVYDDSYAKEGRDDPVWRFTERKLDIIYQGPVAFEKDCFSPLALTNHPF